MRSPDDEMLIQFPMHANVPPYISDPFQRTPYDDWEILLPVQVQREKERFLW
jgi:hypothetical protein